MLAPTRRQCLQAQQLPDASGFIPIFMPRIYFLQIPVEHLYTLCSAAQHFIQSTSALFYTFASGVRSMPSAEPLLFELFSQRTIGP
jgi:hypothetical protein